ncbi:MAG: LPXTG cell wall anchor domain-containing protein, partial [Fermentimonas sp.]|nr:LPXTG cell wall anchor domain-containing protein [Fermentimonas sp.]
INAKNALELSVIMANNANIIDTYGVWKAVYGPIKLGIANGDGTYKFISKPEVAYSITDRRFYLDTLSLSEYDAVQIEGNTVLIPGPDCDSQNPIIITNPFRLIRDENDEWIVDKSFTVMPTGTGDASGNSPNVATGEENSSAIQYAGIGLLMSLAFVLIQAAYRKNKKTRII